MHVECSLALPDPWIRSCMLIKGLVTLAYSSCASTSIVVEPIRFEHCLNCIFDDVSARIPSELFERHMAKHVEFLFTVEKVVKLLGYQALDLKYEQKVILRTISL